MDCDLGFPMSEGAFARVCGWGDRQFGVTFVGKNMARVCFQTTQRAANFSMPELFLRIAFFEKISVVVVYVLQARREIFLG